MTFVVNPYRFATGTTTGDWNALVTAMTPYAWHKLDDAATSTVVADASGNARTGAYPNGTNASFPNRLETPLVTGSTYSLISGGGGNLEINFASPYATNFFTDGTNITTSLTWGAIVKGTKTTAMEWWRTLGQFGGNLRFNMDVTGATVSGALTMMFDDSGTLANGVGATGTGWNDGAPHLLLMEYDVTADSISIWMDGVRIATRTRAGTKPTNTNSYGGVAYYMMHGSFDGVSMDEILWFKRTLTSTEHANLGAFF